MAVQLPVARVVVDLHPCEHRATAAHIEKGVKPTVDRVLSDRGERAGCQRKNAQGIGMQGAFRREHGRGPRALAVEQHGSQGQGPRLGGGEAKVLRLVIVQNRDDRLVIDLLGLARRLFLVLIATAGRKARCSGDRARSGYATQGKAPAAKPLVLPVEQAHGPTPPQRLRAAPGSAGPRRTWNEVRRYCPAAARQPC